MTRWVVDELGPGRAAALHRLPPRLQDAGHPADAAGDADPRPRASPWRNGVRYAYTGNVHDPAGGSTYCHDCGELLIGRDWYELCHWNLDRRRPLPQLRHALRRPLRRPARPLGPRRLPVRLRDFA